MNETAHRFVAQLAGAVRGRYALILDGATGTELDNRGAASGSPLWSGLAALSEPAMLEGIHRAYVSAGADIVTANTFRTTEWAFRKAGRAADWRRAAEASVACARRAAAGGALVAGSVAPLEDCFRPCDAPAYGTASREHGRLCEVLVSAGVDVLWLETFGTLEELAGAMDAAAAITGGATPFAVSVTTLQSGALLSGEPLCEAAAMAEQKGAVAVSINCVPVGHVTPALAALRAATRLPLGVYANLGVPEETQDWSADAYLSPEGYADVAAGWGAPIVGGCCGSSAAHIAALRRRLGRRR